MNQNNLGILIFDHFFSHLQCLGAVHSFGLFYYGGKGPYLGVFPILQYKRPQGEEGFFLGIRMAVTWTVWAVLKFSQGPNLLAQFPTKAQEAGSTQKARHRRGRNLGGSTQ